jgi:hypothetical protein
MDRFTLTLITSRPDLRRNAARVIDSEPFHQLFNRISAPGIKIHSGSSQEDLRIPTPLASQCGGKAGGSACWTEFSSR